MPAEVTASPALERIIAFNINGQGFAFRRPTRGDLAEVARRTAQKLVVTGLSEEARILNELDGSNLQWEARLEVGLQPRVRGGQVLSLGERAPSHWLVPILDHEQKEIGRRVSFDDVTDDEFSAVRDHLDEILKKKAS